MREYIVFENWFHGTEIKIRVQDRKIAASTAKRVARTLCGVLGCCCGRGETGTNGWTLHHYGISTEGGAPLVEEVLFDRAGRVVGVSLIEEGW